MARPARIALLALVGALALWASLLPAGLAEVWDWTPRWRRGGDEG